MAGIRWYEIRDPNGSTIYQQAPTPRHHRWHPPLDGQYRHGQQRQHGLGYSASTPPPPSPASGTPAVCHRPLGTMPQGEGSIINGTGSQTGSQRWGDYTSMNESTRWTTAFWYVNEWVPVTSSVGWQLRIGAFRFPECGSLTSPSALPRPRRTSAPAPTPVWRHREPPSRVTSTGHPERQRQPAGPPPLQHQPSGPLAAP